MGTSETEIATPAATATPLDSPRSAVGGKPDGNTAAEKNASSEDASLLKQALARIQELEAKVAEKERTTPEPESKAEKKSEEDEVIETPSGNKAGKETDMLRFAFPLYILN